MHDFASLKRRVEEEGIDSIDFHVADLVGRFRHLTIPAARFTESVLNEGIGFDGSNYAYCPPKGVPTRPCLGLLGTPAPHTTRRFRRIASFRFVVRLSARSSRSEFR